MIVGVTGKFGVGKSVVARELAEELGAVFVDADKLVHEMYLAGGKGGELIAKNFGEEFMDEAGAVDRAKLWDLVFENDEAREKLNKLIHPLVVEKLREVVGGGGDFVVEAFDLSVDGFEALIDRVVLVKADLERAVENVEKRGGVSGDVSEKVARIWSKQKDCERFDLVVSNDGDLDDLKNKVKSVLVDYELFE